MKVYQNVKELKNVKQLIIPLCENQNLPEFVNEVLGCDISNEVSLVYGDVTELYTLGKCDIVKFIIVGLGDKEKLTRKLYRQAVGKIARSCKEHFAIYVDEKEEACVNNRVYDAVYQSIYSQYNFTKINAEKKEDVLFDIVCTFDVEEVVNKAVLDAKSICHARDLGNMPSNYMIPEKLAEEAKAFAEEFGLRYEILGNKELKELGAGGILGVNRGSKNEARLITIWYEGNPGSEYTALVGKGLTFDAGGYNLKPGGSMRGMKFDMCGGANVLGAFEWIVRNKQKVNVMVVIASTENKIGPDGFTCDEVLVSMSGKTIEITNTDAEGRLILCDALTYAQKLGAKRIIDMATLTGACIVALGKTYTGAFTNSEKFLDELMECAKSVEEKVWPLPIDDDFREQVRKCDVADMTNAVLGGAGGGSSLAAAFLEEFIEEGTEWIHLDIAGPADIASGTDYATQGATGVMIETLGNLLK